MAKISKYGDDNNSLRIFLSISEINKISDGAHLIVLSEEIHYELIKSEENSVIFLKNNSQNENYKQLIFPIEILNELKTPEVLKNGILKYYSCENGKFYLDIKIQNK